MEVVDLLVLSGDVINTALVPTLLMPFALIGVILSSLLTAFAGFFGLDKKELSGSMGLLKVLFKPKVLISMLLLNGLVWGGIYGYRYVKNNPYPEFYIKLRHEPVPSARIYSNSQQDHLDALGTSGELKGLQQAWSIKVGSGNFGGLEVSGGSIFTTSKDGYIYENNFEDGQLIRRFYVGTPVIPKVLIWNGMMYVGEGIHDTENARLYGFDLSSGELKSSFQSLGHIEGDASVHESENGDTILIPAGKGGVYALEADTLQERWHSQVGHVDGEVQISKNKAFVSTAVEREAKERIHHGYALDVDTGKVLWKTGLAASGWSAAVFYENQVCWALGELVPVGEYGQLSCYDQDSGQATVSFNFKGPIVAKPIIRGDNVYVSTYSGEVCSINLKSKSWTWCQQLGDKITYARLTTYNSKYFLYPSSKEGLKFIRARDGELVDVWLPNANEGEWKRHMWGVAIHNNSLLLGDWYGTLRKIDYSPNLSH